MRHHKAYWPWHFAYEAHTTKPHKLESRWHSSHGSSFGVRRPLRYLSHKLDLDDSQTRRLAAVLNQLKTCLLYTSPSPRDS